MTLSIELDQEADGRWIAEVAALPGVLTYGVTRLDAVAKVQALALRALADRVEHGEAVSEFLNVTLLAA
ncbi:MAG: type II toxin-antitoxin system HicB family antitoxin [Gemmatimonadaceae bacterium]|nr:type II toxin-antitoxin system HicB family antitoxin [Gemmatimonadaceae bacterium]